MNSVVWCHTSNTSKARCLLNLFYVHHRVSAQHQTYQTILPDLQEGVNWGTTAFLFPIFFSLDIFPFIIRVYFTVNIDNFQTYPSSSVGTNALIKIWVGSIRYRHVHLLLIETWESSAPLGAYRLLQFFLLRPFRIRLSVDAVVLATLFFIVFVTHSLPSIR